MLRSAGPSLPTPPRLRRDRRSRGTVGAECGRLRLRGRLLMVRQEELDAGGRMPHCGETDSVGVLEEFAGEKFG